jgi:protein-disulfide isomerase/uncharacterized membrane protein
MDRYGKIPSIVILAASLTGAVISILLVREYYGISSGVIKEICTSSQTGLNSCRTVAESPYAAVRGVPFFSAVPVAVFGFLFYGFVAVLGFLNLAVKDATNSRQRFALSSFLSLIGLAADAALLFLSLFVIRAVCSLCTLTYAATVVIFAASVVPLAAGRPVRGLATEYGAFLVNELKSSWLIYGITAITVLAMGLGASYMTKLSFERYNSARYTDERVRNLVIAYRNTSPRSIDVDGSPRMGTNRSPITMVLFIDFTCDHCRDASAVLNELHERYSGKIAVYYKNYPLGGHCSGRAKGAYDPSAGACMAAAGALCAHRQGKFHPVYRGLYEMSARGAIFTKEAIRDLARSLDMSMPAYDSCTASAETRERIARDIAEGDWLGITGTPRLYVNGREIPNECITTPLLLKLVDHILN